MNNKNKQYLEKLYKIGKSMGDIRDYVDRLRYGDKEQYSTNEYIDAEKYEFEFIGYTGHNKEIQIDILDEHELDKILDVG